MLHKQRHCLLSCLFKRDQRAGEPFAVVKASGSVIVGSEDEEMLSVGNHVEPKLAPPNAIPRRVWPRALWV